ncbi:MAG: PilZ domain-containing protein [Polyangiaceae bacterium]
MIRLGRWTPRRPQRHAIRLACQVVRERDFKLIARQVVDLSEVGMRVLPMTRVLTGENLIVSFMAPFTRTWVDAEATVARVDHGRRPGDSGMSLGLFFDHIDEHARALLRLNLASVPPPLPGWRLPS